MAKKKFKLEILDPVGNVVRTHHFFYEQGRDNKIRITIDDKTFFWKNNEGLEFEPKLGVDEHWATEFKARTNKEPEYLNPDTGKTQKLFDENTLIPTWTVKYEDPTRGNKGEAVYMTVSAKDEWDAKTKALAYGEFTQHLTPEFWELRYLTAYKAEGNYIIGKVEYFEGDPRL